MDYTKFAEYGYHHPSARTLTELLEYVAGYSENGMTLHRLNGDVCFVSYKELLEGSKVFASSLKAKKVKGVALLCIDDPKSFILSLWGCIMAGIPAAPLEPLRSNEIQESDFSRLINICKNHDDCTVITDNENIKFYRIMMNEISDERKQCIAVGDLEKGETVELDALDENDVAIIQYSSGSTGFPKGSILTHKNIMYAMGGLVDAFKLGPDTRLAIWTPLFHNMGLFINIVIMQVGGSIDICHPFSYIQDTTSFFKMVAEKKINIITSNNFGVEWALKKVDTKDFKEDSFSSLQAYVVGSEVVSNDTLNNVYEKFKDFGLKKKVLKPCYGLTEAVLAVAITRVEDEYTVFRKEDGSVLVGNGNALPGAEVRIGDESGNFVEDGQYGEILVKSNSIASGYIGSNDSGCNADGWLMTGDIGFIKDGKVFISGRRKEMFIVRGHNYMIHDIEHEVASVSGMPNDKIAICAKYDEVEKEEILILFVAVPKSDRLIEILNIISDRMLSKYGFTAKYAVFIDAISRTGSGKIDRNALIDRFVNKDYIELVSNLQSTADDDSEGITDIEGIIANIWAQVLKRDVSEIKHDIPFYEYGGDSVKQYQMMELLNRTFDLNLHPSFFRQCGTIKEITEGILNQNNDAPEEDLTTVSLRDEVAVTGFAFRLPGAENNDELWDLLVQKRSMVSKLSEERKKLTDIEDLDNWLAEIKDIELFDPEFFNISEKEAKFIDPHQRMIMETSYEALEDAAEAFIRDEPKNVGVYVALNQQPYLLRIKNFMNKYGLEELHENTLAGNLMNVSAARISHFFNFSGICVEIDSACSSFLTALHQARRAIQCGDINSALVSTGHMVLDKGEFDLSQKAGFLSKTGSSKVFDRNADGSVLGEGIVSVFVEPLKTAVEKKKHIYAVIKGSAVNNDGYSLSIMAPNSDGQYDVLRRAYADADVLPQDITYLEAHGTGTKIGDPIELHSLVKLFSKSKQDRDINNTIGIGSIKSNMGHLLPGASGAGFVKILNCFEHKMLVPSANFETINPALNIGKTPFFVVKEPMDWVVPEGKKRLAGITSLGMGGTNAHMILEEWSNNPPEASADFYPLVVSAKTQTALELKIAQLKEYMKQHPDSIGDICYTSCCGRMSFNYRAACVIDKNNIDESFENIRFSVYKRIRSLPVCILFSEPSDENNWLNELKEKVDELGLILKYNKGIFVGDTYLSSSEWIQSTADDIYDKVVVSKESAKVTAPPTKCLKLGLDRDGADISWGMGSLGSKKELMSLLNSLYLGGAEIDWDALAEFKACSIVPLPKYPFAQKPYWI